MTGETQVQTWHPLQVRAEPAERERHESKERTSGKKALDLDAMNRQSEEGKRQIAEAKKREKAEAKARATLAARQRGMVRRDMDIEETQQKVTLSRSRANLKKADWDSSNTFQRAFITLSGNRPVSSGKRKRARRPGGRRMRWV